MRPPRTTLQCPESSALGALLSCTPSSQERAEDPMGRLPDISHGVLCWDHKSSRWSHSFLYPPPKAERSLLQLPSSLGAVWRVSSCLGCPSHGAMLPGK